MSSLIAQLPLAAVWLYCKDVQQTKRFYRDVVGLKPIEGESGDLGTHFDLGTIRLTLLPLARVSPSSTATTAATATSASAAASAKGNVGGKQFPPPVTQQYLVFHVESSIEAVYNDLVKRGVKMKSKGIAEDTMGKTAWFNDPDGHTIYLWQPPRRDSKNFKSVETLVKHYESVSRALADLRQYDQEAKED